MRNNMLTRRKFLSYLLGASAGGFVIAASPPSVGFFAKHWIQIKRWWFGEQWYREHLLAEALSSPEGRVALAQSMVEPIRRSLEYQAIGRKLLLVDELPQGALARYERDVSAIGYAVGRSVPTFEITAWTDDDFI